MKLYQKYEKNAFVYFFNANLYNNQKKFLLLLHLYKHISNQSFKLILIIINSLKLIFKQKKIKIKD